MFTRGRAQHDTLISCTECSTDDESVKTLNVVSDPGHVMRT